MHAYVDIEPLPLSTYVEIAHEDEDISVLSTFKNGETMLAIYIPTLNYNNAKRISISQKIDREQILQKKKTKM